MKKNILNAYGETNCGSIGKHNDDSFCYKTANSANGQIGIFAVADGVGGLPQGSTASGIAISCINRWWEQALEQGYQTKDEFEGTLREAIVHANNQILLESKRQNIQMGTTLSALLCMQGSFVILNTGDSRVYLGEKGLTWKISLLTDDQVVDVAREVNGEIVKKTVLEHCLGITDQTVLFRNQGVLRKNQVFVVCSDGVYKTNGLKKISDICLENRLQSKQLCVALIGQALKNGEKDNITAIAISIAE